MKKRSHATTAITNALGIEYLSLTSRPSLDVVASLPEYAPPGKSRGTDPKRRRAQRAARKVRQASRRKRGRR